MYSTWGSELQGGKKNKCWKTMKISFESEQARLQNFAEEDENNFDEGTDTLAWVATQRLVFSCQFS